VGPRYGLDTAVAKRKIPRHCFCRELNSGHQAVGQVSLLTELPRLRQVDILSKMYMFVRKPKGIRFAILR
jgi:hypothetical protein